MLFLNKVTFTGSAGSEYGHILTIFFCGGPALNHYKTTLGPSSRGLWVGGDKAAHSYNSFFFFYLFILIMINKSVANIRYLGMTKEGGR